MHDTGTAVAALWDTRFERPLFKALAAFRGLKKSHDAVFTYIEWNGIWKWYMEI